MESVANKKQEDRFFEVDLQEPEGLEELDGLVKEEEAKERRLSELGGFDGGRFFSEIRAAAPDREEALPPLYERVCGRIKPDKNRECPWFSW